MPPHESSPAWRLYSLTFLWLLGLLLMPVQHETLRVGVYDNPPLSLWENDEASGFVVDILNYVAEQENWELEYVPCVWDECLRMLQADEIDLLGVIAYSPERARRYDFNQETLISNWGMIYIYEDAPIESVIDLDGRTIAALRDDIYIGALEEILLQFHISPRWVFVPDYAAAMQAVNDHVADAALVNHLFALQFAGSYSRARRTGIIFHPVEIRFAAAKGRHAAELAALDKHLQQLKDDPSSLYYQLLENWFTRSMPKKAQPYLLWALAALTGLALILIGGNYLLHKEVWRRTQELHASESRLRSLLNQAGDPIVLCDPQGHILDANPSACRTLGYSEAELLQLRVHEFAPEFATADALDKLWQRLRAGEIVTIVSTARRKDGSTFPVEVRFSLVEGADQSAMLGVARDISSRIEVQEELEKRNRELEILRQAALSLTTELSLTAVLEALLAYALALLPADDAHIFLYDGETLSFGAARWRDGRTGVPFAMPRPEGITYRVARQGKPVVISDMAASPLFREYSSSGSLEGAITGIPLSYQGRIIGVMNIAFLHPYEFSDTELSLLGLLADQAAVAIVNAQLYEQVQKHAHELDQRVAERTAELERFIDAMAGRELRMVELKQVIKALRQQLLAAGLQPVADDPLGAVDIELDEDEMPHDS